jgi:DNA replication protein DnaC
MRGWTFQATIRTAENALAHDYGRELAARPRWLYTLQGTYGIGKTRLLACLVNGGRAAGWTSVYVTMAELLDHLRRAYAPSVPALTFDGLWDRIVNATILAIDECDRFNPTPWAQEKFFELIDLRYRAGSQCCTAFATNASLDDLDVYLASRMRGRGSRVFEMTGGDLRQAGG